MMNNQLAARSIITRDSTKDPDSSLPSGWLGTAGSDGIAAQDAANVFNGHTQPVIKAAPQKPPVISSGVATGMLIHKTPPVYPPAAKAARLSGTVEVHATISKDGTIRDLRAVSGPEVLRQAAVDAVRTWRYKPYELNNEPVEVETTVNVIFSLGG
jgi:protein TonB